MHEKIYQCTIAQIRSWLNICHLVGCDRIGSFFYFFIFLKCTKFAKIFKSNSLINTPFCINAIKGKKRRVKLILLTDFGDNTKKSQQISSCVFFTISWPKRLIGSFKHSTLWKHAEFLVPLLKCDQLTFANTRANSLNSNREVVFINRTKLTYAVLRHFTQSKKR